MDLIAELDKLVPEMKQVLAGVKNMESLEKYRISFMGRKGRIAAIMSQLSKIPPGERPRAGQKANSVKEELVGMLQARKGELEEKAENSLVENFDPSMPGRSFWNGSLHPVTQVMEDICNIFTKLGFEIVSGPEVETDYYNFEALNIPPDHPARDMQDTLYITDKIMLRTHTSPVQARTMLSRKPPIAVIAPGKVYRRDSDLTHTPMFHQVEGLMVDKGISMADLRGALLAFVRAEFGHDTRMRFRPSFFPFTEPSAEVDISCVLCRGKGQVNGEPCRVCKGSGWVEILGSGMVDPNVFEAVGYDGVTGFAFGMGVERIAMLKFGITDLRMFFMNEVRFLSQFGINA